MADIINRTKYDFPEQLVTDLISNVRGESSLAALCPSSPIPFSGQKEYTFNMDDEVDLVAEGGAKSRAGMSFTPRTIMPVKIEYGSRITDEFMYASAELRLQILKNFNEGFARKAARGLDIMGFHGVNPRTGAVSALLGDNYFDNGVTVITPSSGEDANDLVERAIEGIMAHDYDVDGIAMAPVFRSDLSKLTYTDGRRMFPELTWGKMAGSLNGLTASVNNTVNFGNSDDRAIIGDFARGFKWGYVKKIEGEIIPYGDPDNSGRDLKGHNEVYLRCEMYLAWAILDKNAFAVIQAA